MVKKITLVAFVLISICISVWRRDYMDPIALIINIVLLWLNVIAAFKLVTKGFEQTKKFTVFAICANMAWVLHLWVYAIIWFIDTLPILSIALGIILVGIVWGDVFETYKAVKENKESNNIIQFPRRSGR